jgi:hypothetical protein
VHPSSKFPYCKLKSDKSYVIKATKMNFHRCLSYVSNVGLGATDLNDDGF